MVKLGSSMGMPNKIKLEEPESSSSSEDLRNGADVTFGELQEVRSNGSHVVHLKPKEEMGGRANKNRLLALSLSLDFERLFKVQKKVVHNPRFESLCGELDVDLFPRLSINTHIDEVMGETEIPTETVYKFSRDQCPKNEHEIELMKPYASLVAEIRKKRLVEKYKQLKASGKLEAFIEKRSRKNAAKDHRYMPYRGPDATE
ncbi:unnamed protein product [Malus baccata var. baccata]